jgi:hypothetical protein
MKRGLAMMIHARYRDVTAERWEQLTGRDATLFGSGGRFRHLQAAKFARVGGAA